MNKKLVKRSCLLVAIRLLLIIIPAYVAPASPLISQFTMTNSKDTVSVTYSFLSESASGTSHFRDLPSGKAAVYR